MKFSGQTIWDTKVQSICGLLTADNDGETEIYFSASFAQLTLEPARVVVENLLFKGAKLISGVKIR